MKLVVLGANGRTGTLVLQAALDRQMDVTAVVRSADRRRAIAHDRLTSVVGNACDPSFLKDVFEGQDVVISTLGGRLPTKTATAIYYRSAKAIVEAAQEAGVKRVLVTSSALLFPARTLLEKLLHRLVPNVVHSAERMEAILEESHLNWTVACCGFLKDERTCDYRAQRGGLAEKGDSVSRAALAAFLLDAIERPDAQYSVFGVSRASA